MTRCSQPLARGQGWGCHVSCCMSAAAKGMAQMVHLVGGGAPPMQGSGGGAATPAPIQPAMSCGVDLAHGRGGKVEERNSVADSPGCDTASTLPEAFALQVETGFVLARHRSVEAAWDVPPKRSTQDAALADALRRTPAPEAPRIVDARKDAHAGSLRRGRQAKTVSNPRQDSRVPQQTRQGDNDCDAV